MNHPVLTLITTWADIIIPAVLVYRAIRGGFFFKYPIFYTYLSYGVVEGLFRTYFQYFRYDLYGKAYWSTQFVSVSIGYCVVWEIFRQALARYPGAARLAKACLAAILLIVLTKGALSTAGGTMTWQTRYAADLEKDFRVVLAALLVTIAGLVAYYSIPLGRNVKGMLMGYGGFIGLTVIHLAIHQFWGARFQPIWQHMGWVSYSAALAVWCATLWSYHPNPVPVRFSDADDDYMHRSGQTERLLGTARSSLGRVARP